MTRTYIIEHRGRTRIHALVLCKDWGVKALIGGGLLIRPGKE